MGYEITKFNFQDDLASANFNVKIQEIETYLNNIQEELKNVKEKNIEIEKENQKLKEQLNNKVEKTDKTVYKKLQDVQGVDVDILDFTKNLKASGYFQLFYQNKNVPTTGNWDWAFANIFYYNETTILLEIRAIFPPHSTAKNTLINNNWTGWTVV